MAKTSELEDKIDDLEGLGEQAWESGLPDYQRGRYPLQPGQKLTYEEFLDWADEDTLAEWVDGEIELSSPASIKHQRILGFLYDILNTYMKVTGLGEIILPPFQMKLTKSGREPDLIFLHKNHATRLENGLVRSPADLAVEIVSPESKQRDREKKLAEYEAGGVPEYWLIDTTEDKATFYQLDLNGKYQAVNLDVEGRYHSASVKDFWLKPAWLWRQRLPDAVDVLRKMTGTAFDDYLNNRPYQNDL